MLQDNTVNNWKSFHLLLSQEIISVDNHKIPMRSMHVTNFYSFILHFPTDNKKTDSQTGKGEMRENR